MSAAIATLDTATLSQAHEAVRRHRGLSAAARLVMAEILSHACRKRGHKHYGCAWPSVARLAEVLGLSRATVQRAKKALAEAGLIEREERSGAAGARTDLITICWNELLEAGRKLKAKLRRTSEPCRKAAMQAMKARKAFEEAYRAKQAGQHRNIVYRLFRTAFGAKARAATLWRAAGHGGPETALYIYMQPVSPEISEPENDGPQNAALVNLDSSQNKTSKEISQKQAFEPKLKTTSPRNPETLKRFNATRLWKRLANLPSQIYEAAIQAMTPELEEQAALAEYRHKGSGVQIVLKALEEMKVANLHPSKPTTERAA